MMKKILIIIIACLVLCACKDQKNTERQILLSNNYSQIWCSDFAPNSIPIKKQKITKIDVENNIEEITTIESNSDGFITAVFINEDKIIGVDYKNSNIKLMIKDKTLSSFQLTLDENKNIINLFNDQNKQVYDTELDEKGRISKSENKIWENNAIEQYTYLKDRLDIYSLEQEEKVINNVSLGSSIKTYYFYNQQNQLIKSVTQNFILIDKKKLSNIIRPKGLRESKITCFYLSHNQYGDWTESFCLNRFKQKNKSVSRVLEY